MGYGLWAMNPLAAAVAATVPATGGTMAMSASPQEDLLLSAGTPSHRMGCVLCGLDTWRILSTKNAGNIVALVHQAEGEYGRGWCHQHARAPPLPELG